MTAAELRALAERLNTLAEGYGPFIIADQLLEAAEVLALLAWAEERAVQIERVGAGWWAQSGSLQFTEPTLIGTLQRAREASK